MKAVRIHQYDGPEVLKYEEAPQPNPMPGDVLIRVHAAAVNPVDWMVREGYLRERLKHSLPLILGWDLSGVVEATAAGVSQLKIGDEIYSRPDLSRRQQVIATRSVRQAVWRRREYGRRI